MEKYFPEQEYQERWERVYGEMDRRGFKTAVVWGRSGGTYERCGDVLYLTNYYSNHSGHEMDTELWNARSFNAAILADNESPELHTDDLNVPRDLIAPENVHGHADVVAGLAEALQRRQISGPVAFVGWDFMPVKYVRQLEAALPSIEWVPADDLIETVRQIKSPLELDCYREAGEIATAGLDAMLEAIVAGKTEAEAAAVAAYEMMSRGGFFERFSLSFGERLNYFSRDPICGYTLDAPGSGELARVAMRGPIWQGYWLDPCRCAVVGGNPADEQRALVEQNASIVESVIGLIKPGVPFRELAEVGERMIKEFSGDYEDPLADEWPILGHGVGLFWERPWISSDLLDGSELVQKNMVLGIEAFLAHEGVGNTMIESNVIVTEDGSELITPTPTIPW